MGYESISRDSQNTTRYKFPFTVTIKLPKPQIAREIIRRDQKGRIIEAR